MNRGILAILEVDLPLYYIMTKSEQKIILVPSQCIQSEMIKGIYLVSNPDKIIANPGYNKILDCEPTTKLYYCAYEAQTSR